MKGSTVTKLLLAVVLALAGLCITVGFIGVQTGNITIIFGDKNKVDNRDQSQTVVQPVKPEATDAKPTEPTQAAQPVTPPVTVSDPQPQPASESHHVASLPRTRYYESDDQDESEDECVCTCPADEEAGDEGEKVEEEDDGGGQGLQTAA